MHNHQIREFEVKSSLPADENLILTQQIATPYYKAGALLSDDRYSIQDVLEVTGIDLTQELYNNFGDVIDINEYTLLVSFFEIYLTNPQNDRKYDTNGTVSVSASFDQLKDCSEVILICIAANSNEVYFIGMNEYDPNTGEITLELPELGAMAILGKPE